MSAKNPPLEGYDDSPEWTEADFKRARPASVVHSPRLAATMLRSKGGRPRGSDKEQISLRIDKEVLERFRANGPGWQTKMNSALRKAVGL